MTRPPKHSKHTATRGRGPRSPAAGPELKALQEVEFALRERLKEMTCLYQIRHDMMLHLPLDELCTRVIERLIPAMQFPELTVPYIELDNRRFTSENYRADLTHGLHAEIVVGGQACGRLSVYYTEDRSFLVPEEANLIQAIAEDLSLWIEHGNAAEALRAGEARLRALIEQAPVAISITRDGREIYTNPKLRELLGNPPPDAASEQTALNYIAPQYREELQERLRRRAHGLPVSSEYEAVGLHTNGSEIPIHVALGSVQLEDGPATIAFVTEITNLKLAETALRSSEERFRLLFEQSPDAIWLIDPHNPAVPWQIVDCNAAACEMHGYRRDEIIGRSVAMFATDFDNPQRSYAGPWPEIYGSGEDFHRRKDGTLFQIEYRTVPITLGGRKLVMGVDRDITERKQIEAVLQASEEYLRALVEHSAEIITVVNSDGTVRYTSPAQRRLLGYEDDGSGEHMFTHIHPDDRPRLNSLFQQFMASDQSGVTTELRVGHRDGSWRIFESTGTNLLNNPAVRGIVVNSHDITERKRAEEQLVHDAIHDALTGLPNRALFTDRLGHALDRAKRPGNPSCAVLLLDVDRFKTINDSLGHTSGDHFLHEVAYRIEQCIRPGDTLARFGGDEFAILFEDMAALHTATDVAEHIRTVLRTPFMLAEQEIITSASIGIALCAPEHTHPEQVLRDADIAMYHAKQQRSGGYIVADPSMHAAVMMRLETV